MSPDDELAGAIPDHELRRVALSEQAEPVSVLIEVAVTPPRVRVSGGRPVRVEDAPPEGGDQVAGARAQLTALLGAEPVWLASAGVFCADVTGTQLEQVARSPLVRRIHPNRRHR